MLGSTPNWLVVVIAILLTTLYIRHAHGSVRRKLPPGPLGLPLVGNLLQIPGRHLATYFRGLLEEYGGLVSLNLASFRVILIGDLNLAKALLEKHASKHSSRPVVPYIRYHLDPMKTYWGAAEEGETHTIGRKLTVGVMSAVRAGKTEQLQWFEAVRNIQNILNDDGKGWFYHMERVAASVVLAAGFGMHCPTGHEPELKAIMNDLRETVRLTSPSGSIINALPFLDLIPGPMPWRTRALSFRKQQSALYKTLIDDALTGKASDMNTWATAFASDDKPEGDQRQLLKQFTAAAIETTAVSLQTFVLACICHPEWIVNAQKELDDVVGPDRLPSFNDRPFLPYLEAVVRETLRWRPAARFGIPHQSVADDVIEYQGKEYFIPKGSIIFAVTWAIEHDQSRFEEPGRFNPERFLDAKGTLKPEYETSAFGFGRRLCPGIPFAERSIWIDVATMLWTFNIRGSSEPDPNTGLPFHYQDGDAAFNGDLTNAPFNFPAVFEPRSSQRVEVARREWSECEKDLTVLLPAQKEN